MSPRKALHFGIIIGGDVTYTYKDEQLGAGASFPSLSSLPRPYYVIYQRAARSRHNLASD